MYPEERKVGNQFEVDISIVCPSPVETITSIDQTVNYVDVYSITQDVFSTHYQFFGISGCHLQQEVYITVDFHR